MTHTTDSSTLFLDIGNSRLKLASVSAASADGPFDLEMKASWDRYDDRAVDELCVLLDGVESLKGVSVVQELRKAIDEQMPGKTDWVESSQIPAHRSLYREISSLGTDRFLLADAAWRASGMRSNVVVIGAGTACTIDLMNAEGIHQGGAILPGIRTLQRSFEICMPGLPEVETASPSDWPGRSTREGIQWGQIGMLRSALDDLLEKSVLYFGKDMDVYISGGDADQIRDILHFSRSGIRSVVTDPWLLFKGLYTSDHWRLSH